MGIFKFLKEKEVQPQPEKTEVKVTSKEREMDTFSFSSFLRKDVSNNNLSIPLIDTKLTVQGKAIRFGEDNLFPQTVNRMYIASPLHRSITDWVVSEVAGNGYEVESYKNETIKQQILFKEFEQKLDLINFLPEITKDFYLHGRINTLLEWNEDHSKIVNTIHLDPATIRAQKTDKMFENFNSIKNFVYAKDWEGNAKYIEIPRFNRLAKNEMEIFAKQSCLDIYPITPSNSSLNWQYLDGAYSFYHKNFLQESIWPQYVILLPEKFGSVEAYENFVSKIKNNKGEKYAGKSLVLNGVKGQMPDIKPIPNNQNDKLFVETSKELKDQIAFSHGINPGLVGIKVAGQLGATEELKLSYKTFKGKRINPLRLQIENYINELGALYGLQCKIKLKEPEDIFAENKEGRE